jgi:hypothetical protein
MNVKFSLSFEQHYQADQCSDNAVNLFLEDARFESKLY